MGVYRRRRWFGPKRAVALVLLIVLVGGGVWHNRQQSLAESTNGIVEAISRLAVVPTDEKPSVTTVVDKTKVNQPFLRNAENGDQVVLYFQAGRAVVYRPSTNKIVNMGPLETPKPRVFLRNGTSGDIPSSFVGSIVDGGDYLLASRDNSAKKTYTQTIVVDVAGNRPDVATKLAKLLGAKVSDMPTGETRPDADILVIVGSDAR